MIYRVGLGRDHQAIKELVNATGYYNPIFPETMGGRWVVAENDGTILGCVWVMIEKPNAYIDFWVGKGRTAARLLAEVESGLERLGIKLIRAMIHESNESAIRMACYGLGCYGATGYVLIAKELQNGRTEDNDD